MLLERLGLRIPEPIGDVFDGVNLAQSALESPMSLGTGVLEHRVFDLVAQEFTTQLAGSMSGTVQVSP